MSVEHVFERHELECKYQVSFFLGAIKDVFRGNWCIPEIKQLFTSNLDLLSSMRRKYTSQTWITAELYTLQLNIIELKAI